MSHRGASPELVALALILSGSVFTGGTAVAQQPLDPALHQQRILGIVPNYQTVSDPNAPYVPLTPAQKWRLVARQSRDPFNIASAALGSGFSQLDDATPKYGQGGASYAKRFGAAWADASMQNLFSGAILASLLHQDPRYFRKGPQATVRARVLYSLSRILITRNDSGEQAFNASGIFGLILGIAGSNLYYPSESRTGTVMVNRLKTSFFGAAMGNLLPEFWPDIYRKIFRRGQSPQSPVRPQS